MDVRESATPGYLYKMRGGESIGHHSDAPEAMGLARIGLRPHLRLVNLAANGGDMTIREHEA